MGIKAGDGKDVTETSNESDDENELGNSENGGESLVSYLFFWVFASSFVYGRIIMCVQIHVVFLWSRMAQDRASW